ncbi:NAD(+) diphosphatase [Pseudobutyrivibrio xylanivorans]|uniref:NAD(+) diphosphatase n=1 Tax=Pseudobutyrivibrio xylanivorans DSM 14809 TaxID=1123012 RepID=A0A1M6LLQ8_PSEXY|nr:NAD(+) diphosphatase [Pseudobutyrivibrio xylanivorans]SHJ72093.1 NAD+ diphosphatase [Pseudobutyrivibrio xylanivorans DSM 14809]
MIQDISPKKLLNSYSNKSVNANSLIVIFKNKKIMLRMNTDNKTIVFPTAKELGINQNYTYLFSIDNEDFFFVDVSDVLIPNYYDFYDMRELRKEYFYPKHYIFAAYTAYHLMDWYETTKYCGRCGAINENSLKERARVCPSCGNIVYPRINPAVIVGIINGDKLLLTKYRTGFTYNALVAGFTEIGESLEETVKREVQEETGLRVKNIRYYKSQPWGIACDILMGFFCDVEGDDIIKMDKEELKYAQWVPRKQIELQPLEYSLTNEMMKVFKEDLV